MGMVDAVAESEGCVSGMMPRLVAVGAAAADAGAGAAAAAGTEAGGPARAGARERGRGGGRGGGGRCWRYLAVGRIRGWGLGCGLSAQAGEDSPDFVRNR